MDNSLIIDAVRAALERGGQHILIAPDGGVSIWPDTDATVTRCKDCKNWGCTFVSVMEGMFEKTRTCNITEMATKPDDFCSYAEAKDNADGETPLSAEWKNELRPVQADIDDAYYEYGKKHQKGRTDD